jgi:intracellular multiplication protein IcmL
MKERLLPKVNTFYCNHYHQVIAALIGLLIVLIIIVNVVFYQMVHRPEPKFYASLAGSNQGLRQLTYFKEPNLLSSTILRWASKAATIAYTFDFVSYQQQIAQARPFFTDAGWQDYLASVKPLINTIVQNQLFVNGVVSGTPVISNEGPLPDVEYAWRVQIPFLVVYQSANRTSPREYFVALTIVRVPTTVNPEGIGIDRFVMVTGSSL